MMWERVKRAMIRQISGALSMAESLPLGGALVARSQGPQGQTGFVGFVSTDRHNRHRPAKRGRKRPRFSCIHRGIVAQLTGVYGRKASCEIAQGPVWERWERWERSSSAQVSRVGRKVAKLCKHRSSAKTTRVFCSFEQKIGGIFTFAICSPYIFGRFSPGVVLLLSPWMC